MADPETQRAAAPTILAGGATPPSDTINVAMIGTGTQGSVLYEQVVKIQEPNVRFRAVCDIWPYARDAAARRLAAYRQPVKAYTDYQEMLAAEKGLDAVIVATPDWMHAEHSIACLEAGLNVYCEKEMSNDLAKARAMVLAARKTAKLLQIGHQRRSNPRYIHCREKLLGEARLFGRLTHVYGQWNRSVAASASRGTVQGHELDDAALKQYGYDTMDRFRDWRWYKKFGGGPISDLGSHQVDVYGWFLGSRPMSVRASGGNDYWKQYEWYDNVMALYEFPTPQGVVHAYYQVLTTTSARGYFETFFGTEGTVQISEDPKKCRLYPEADLPQVNGQPPWEQWVKKGLILPFVEAEELHAADPKQEPLWAEYKAPTTLCYVPRIDEERSYHMAHLQNFFEAVRGKAKLNCPAEEAYETAVQVLRVNEAVASGQPITFKEEDFKT
jgi:predicted dehydrogenase